MIERTACVMLGSIDVVIDGSEQARNSLRVQYVLQLELVILAWYLSGKSITSEISIGVFGRILRTIEAISNTHPEPVHPDVLQTIWTFVGASITSLI
jgi:hypothetical protein